MSCPFQSAVGRRGRRSSPWDRLYGTENMDSVKGKRWMCALDLEEKLLDPREGGAGFL
jgi:hypothetical protein